MSNDWDSREDDEEGEFGPGSADYDLSEEYGYMSDDRPRPVIPQWAMVAVTVIALVALITPTIYLIWRFG